ncbi:hypothetical protein EV360DRAFT_89124 [Lentinula raphanica]|nr:hypothetical protein EV360DRAFT_89124 [Lentinula raphanica]
MDLNSAKNTADVTVRLLIRYHRQKPDYASFRPQGPPINTGQVQKEISQLGLPYCRKDAIEVTRLGQIQIEWYFTSSSKGPQSMSRKLCAESNSSRAKEIEDWMHQYYIFRITVTCKEKGCPPRLIVKIPADPSYNNLPVFRQHTPSTPTGDHGTYAENFDDQSPRLGRYSISDTTDYSISNRNKSPHSSSIASTPRSRSPATTAVDHEPMNHLVPPSTSTTFVEDSIPRAKSPATVSVDNEQTDSLVPPSTSTTLVEDSTYSEAGFKVEQMRSVCTPPRYKREREDDFSPRDRSRSSTIKRSRWDSSERSRIQRSPKQSAFKSVSSSPNTRSFNSSTAFRRGERESPRNSFSQNFSSYRRSSSVFRFGPHPELSDNEHDGRLPQRTPTPSLSGHMASSSNFADHASQKDTTPSGADPSTGQAGEDTKGSAPTTTNAPPPSLLPISPVDLSKLFDAISTVTASAAPSNSSEAPVSDQDSAARTLTPMSTDTDSTSVNSTTISMSDIASLLKALPAASSLPASQQHQQATNPSSATEVVSDSIPAQTSVFAPSSTGTPLVPMQTSHGQHAYPASHSHVESYQYPCSSYVYPPSGTQANSQSSTAFPANIAQPVDVQITEPPSTGNSSSLHVKEEPIDVLLSKNKEIPADANSRSTGMTRIVQLRSDLVQTRKEIRERSQKEKSVLAELAKLVEKLKLDFVLGERDGDGFEGFGNGSELELGLHNDEEFMERPSSSEVEAGEYFDCSSFDEQFPDMWRIDLQSSILIMQAQLSSERNGRKQAEQAKTDAESAKRDAEAVLKELVERVCEAERSVKEIEQKFKATEAAQGKVEDEKKELQLKLQEALDRRREADQLRRTAEHAKNVANDRRKEADDIRKDAEYELRQAKNRRWDAEKARKDAEHDKRRAESDRRDMDEKRRVAEQGRRDAESAFREMEERCKNAELARKEAEERTGVAEAFVDDVKRECKEPFVVPALVDAFFSISKLTTKANEVETLCSIDDSHKAEEAFEQSSVEAA